MNIEILGTVCIDKNTSENSSYVAAGSPPMYMDKIFRQFGDCSTTIVASYGKDYLGYIKGVRILPSLPNAENTLVYENVTKNGQRTQKSYNRDSAFAVEITDEIKDDLSKADIVFFAPQQPIYTREYLVSVIDLLKKDALRVLLPQGFYRKFDSENNVLVREFEEASEILPLMDIVIVSEQDAPDMLDVAKGWSKESKVIPVVTVGAKGAIALKRGEEIKLPGIPVPEEDIIDSVGSGDIFSASFAYKYKQTGNIELAGKFANAVARQCLFYTSDNIKIDLRKI